MQLRTATRHKAVRDVGVSVHGKSDNGHLTLVTVMWLKIKFRGKYGRNLKTET